MNHDQYQASMTLWLASKPVRPWGEPDVVHLDLDPATVTALIAIKPTRRCQAQLRQIARQGNTP